MNKNTTLYRNLKNFIIKIFIHEENRYLLQEDDLDINRMSVTVVSYKSLFKEKSRWR